MEPEEYNFPIMLQLLGTGAVHTQFPDTLGVCAT